jgi:hypothetical protein
VVWGDTRSVPPNKDRLGDLLANGITGKRSRGPRTSLRGGARRLPKGPPVQPAKKTSSMKTRICRSISSATANHPATLLKVYLYGNPNRVQLERETQHNIELMWLTGRFDA